MVTGQWLQQGLYMSRWTGLLCLLHSMHQAVEFSWVVHYC